MCVCVCGVEMTHSPNLGHVIHTEAHPPAACLCVCVCETECMHMCQRLRVRVCLRISMCSFHCVCYEPALV